MVRADLETTLATLRSESEESGAEARAQRARLLEAAATVRADVEQLGSEQIARLGELVERVASTERAAAEHAGTLESIARTRIGEIEQSITDASSQLTRLVEDATNLQLQSLHDAGDAARGPRSRERGQLCLRSKRPWRRRSSGCRSVPTPARPSWARW